MVRKAIFNFLTPYEGQIEVSILLDTIRINKRFCGKLRKTDEISQKFNELYKLLISAIETNHKAS